MRQKRRSYREHDDDEGVHEDDFAAVNERLDDLTRQLARMAQANAAPRPSAPAPAAPVAPDRVAEALARLDRRLDQVIAEGRAAASNFECHSRYAASARADVRAGSADTNVCARSACAAAEPRAGRLGRTDFGASAHARRQARRRAGTPTRDADAPSHAAAGGSRASSRDLGIWPRSRRRRASASRNQLADFVAAPALRNAFNALRSDLAEIGQALNEALPRRAVEALEAEVHSLAERVDRSRQAGAEGAALAALERELAEVRNALQHLTPAESLAGFQDAVQALSHKIDQIGAGAAAPQDPLAFKQLE